ncbi:hypothetical protein KJ870_09415 [bacterium]|nr:hypothetical protein [bacterium]MBU1435143.1 hypothetical protein [bacterium]MBU1502800.1 hypothetical protein [bacterium]
MARIRRILIPNTAHHITQRGLRSMNIFFKKGFMAKHPWDYKYSSARYRLNLVEEDKLLSNCTQIDRIVNYKEFLQENVEIKFIKEKTRIGKPCGDDEFYDKIKSLIGIDYKNKKAGRPKKGTH